MAAGYETISQNDPFFGDSTSHRLCYALLPPTPLKEEMIESLEPLFFPGLAEFLADPLSPSAKPGGSWPIDE